MKFTVLSIRSHHENESDYETAVEMSHSSIEERTIRLRSETGVVVELEDTEISTTSSYLEPDFEHMDKTGETVYVNLPSEDEPKLKQYAHGKAFQVAPLPVLSTEDLEALEEWGDQEGWEDDRNAMPNDVRQQLIKWSDYQRSLNGQAPYVRLNDETAQRLIDWLPANARRRQVFNLPLSPEEQQFFERLGQQNKECKQANQKAAFENNITRNVLRAKEEIAGVVEVARQRFRMP